jgi:hypothetical protein
VGPENLHLTKEAGIELGFFFQFGTLSYIMTAIVNTSNKEAAKKQLESISSMLSYLSFEIVEDMLYKMKTLNLAKIQ